MAAALSPAPARVLRVVVTPAGDLREAARSTLRDCVRGRLDYHKRRETKAAPMDISDAEREQVFAAARAALDKAKIKSIVAWPWIMNSHLI